MNLRIDGAVVTDAGSIRSRNEDNYYLFGNYRYDISVNTKTEQKDVLAGQALAAVYDGMGGEEAGETASLTAVRFFMPCRCEEMRKEALHQVMCANEEICRQIRNRGGSRIGTTAVMLYLDEEKALCCNVGDSRCYFMRDGVLQQISVDHSEAQKLMQMGILDAKAARASKSWHRLTQHLGIFPDEFVIEPHFSQEIKLQEGDLFLLGSDGLTDMVMDDEIAEILQNTQDAETASQNLVDAALQHGGKDNVTAMVLRIYRPSVWQEIGEQMRKVPVRVWIGLLILAAMVSILV